MDQKKKKSIKQIVAAVCAAALVLTLALMPILAKENPEKDGPTASILSGKAELGSIERKIIGGGTLTNADSVSVSVPAAVKLTGFSAVNGQSLRKGDAIATVDRVTVMTAIKEVQTTLDLLAEDIESERKKAGTETVTALAGGTVKKLYAAAGDSVQSVMLKHGALALLSLDGLMAVDLETDTALAIGTQVTVSFENGKSASGQIASNLEGVVSVTLEDDGYAIGEKVLIRDENGAELGSGPLYVYSSWSAAAYTGSVKKINVSDGDSVKAGKTLLTLSDTGYTAKYQKLVSQRREYEELLQTLFEMYQSQKLVAPCDGIVSGIDQNSTLLLSSYKAFSVTLLANAPNGDDESLYANHIARVSSVGENGWALQLSSQSFPVDDYKNPPGDLIASAPLTQVTVFDPTPDSAAPLPVYELNGDAWVSVDLGSISEGDVLLLAKDLQGNTVWAVRLQKASSGEKPSQPSGGTGNRPNMGGLVSSGGNRIPQMNEEEEENLYDLTETEIATVTSSEKMTLEISVDELDVRSIQIGMEAQIKINALGGEKVTAQVSDIGNIGTSNGGNSKFTVTLSLPKSENMLAGMMGTATIVPETVANSVTVPAKALVEEEGKTVIYTAYDEKEGVLIRPVEVKVGVSDGETVQILSGIAEGETYYYAYYDTLEISNTPDFGNRLFGR